MPAVNYTPIIVVDTTNMDESTWHSYRRKGIGGSDVAAVYGQSPFCTTRDLYYQTIGQWITAVLAYICIVYIMFNGAQRLEKRQMKRYGDNEEYNTYADKTPIIIPLLPIYHLNKKQ